MNPEKTKKRKLPGGLLKSSLVLALVCPAAALAQDDESEEEIFELTPFSVGGESAIGYRATSTLAGSRINTDLKDLGAAISVVTSEFLEDTQANNAQELFANLTSLEIGGTQGNYSSQSDNSGGAAWGGFHSQDLDLDPQSTARVRGLERPNFTRGFFSSSIPIESYNTGTLTVSRGANSLLFGLGAAGGVIDAGLNEAIIGQEETEFGLTFDNNGSVRSTFSLARTLVEDRLAIRIDALNGDTKYQQDPAFEDSERYYGAIKAVLFKNEGVEWLGKTSLKAAVETGEISTTPPSPNLPVNGFESFFSPPTVDYTLFTPRDGFPGSGRNADRSFPTFEALVNAWEKYAGYDGRITPNLGNAALGLDRPSFNTPAVPNGDFAGWGHPSIFDRPIVVYPSGGDGSSDFGVNGAQGTVGFSRTRNLIVNGNPGTGRLDVPFNLNSRAYQTNFQNFLVPSLTDRNIFDYRNYLYTGNLKRVVREFDWNQVTLEQIFFGGKGGIELALANESVDRMANLPFGGAGRDNQFAAESQISFDVIEYFASGEKNPNFGKPFIQERTNPRFDRFEDRDNLRATAFYEHDFNDNLDGKLGRFLGKHRFTTLFQEDDYTDESRQSALFMASTERPGATAGEEYTEVRGATDRARIVSRFHSPVYKVYLSDESYVGKEITDVRLRPARFNPPQEGDVYKFYTIDPSVSIVDGDVAAAITNKEWLFERQFNSGNISRQVVSSEAAVWQSFLANNHIIGLVGWRTDEVESYSRISEDVRNALGGLNINRHNTLEAESQTEKANTFTWSVVGHLPDRYLESLPVSRASFHIGEGENFSAIQVRNDIFGNAIPNPSGLTKEVGITLGFAQDKWNLKINRFETDSAYASVGGVAGGIQNIFYREALQRFTNLTSSTSALPFAQQPHAAAGFSSYQDVVDTIIASIPESTRSIYDYQLNGGLWEARDEIDNLTSTRSVSSEGYEIELVGNPTNNWRVSFNAAQVEAVNSDSVAAANRWMREVLANWDTSGLSDVPTGVLEDDGSGNPPVLSDGGRSFEQYAESTIATVDEQLAQDGLKSLELRELRVNLVTGYDFSEGRFKGFGVGTALRYQSAVSTGYRYEITEDGRTLPVVGDPFEGDSEINGDLWFSYKKRLADKVDWKIQLNIRNAIGSQGNILIRTNPDGAPAVFRNAPERVWSLRNTFSF